MASAVVDCRMVLAASAFLVSLLAMSEGAQASDYAVLYSFCAQRNGCPDGDRPNDDLIMDGAGNLIGTTEMGGADVYDSDGGTVFKVAPDGSETVLYSFCAQPNCADGNFPSGGLVSDMSGNFYGTTLFGGAYDTDSGGGTVFKLAADGTETVLHSFCAQTNCTDGSWPSGRMLIDGKGNLYGTTENGGRSSGCGPGGCGVIFRLAPDGKEKVLYSFCTLANCADGALPGSSLLADNSGNFYGTTSWGGANCSPYYDCGTVFRLAPDGTETVLYSFCGQTNCADGERPSGDLAMDKAGNLYGTTYYGGGSGVCNGVSGCGTVFRLAPDGTETVLHAFSGTQDGALPTGGVIPDKQGNLFGSTSAGGRNLRRGRGVAFEIASGGTERLLHLFGGKTGGATPSGGLMLGNGGYLYGTTIGGDSLALGTVYKLKK